MRAKTRAAFVPPKPLDVESATRRSRRVASATRFIRSDVGSGAARCAVAGARQSLSARTAKQASSAPAAPSRWPVAPFVDATSLRLIGLVDGSSRARGRGAETSNKRTPQNERVVAAPPFEQSLERRELGRVAGGRAGRVRVHVVD